MQILITLFFYQSHKIYFLGVTLSTKENKELSKNS